MPANVRIQPESYTKLRKLAESAGASLPDVLAEAIEELYRKRFVEQCNRQYARLRKNSKAWKQELRERRDWERTLGDGLEDA